MDIAILSLAFGSGIATFFSPCSVALLPAYVSYTIRKNEELDTKAANTVVLGARFGILASLGILTVVASFGLVFSLIGNFLAPYAAWIGIITGAFLILLGLYLLSGRYVSFPLAHTIKSNNSLGGQYLFGVAYALGSLACTLPVFLLVISLALSFGSFALGVLTFSAYSLAIVGLMVGVALISTVSRQAVSSYLTRAVPIINKVSPIIIILAGAYLIYFQLRAFYL